MKKIYIIATIGLLACATMLAVGCKKEGGKVMLRARIAQDTDTKVYMNGSQACWHEGDLVNVNGDVCQAENVHGATADFYGTPLTDSFFAVYPASIVTRNGDDGIIILNLPDVQAYDEDSQGRQIVKVPLGGVTDEEAPFNMTLYPLSSLVKIVLSSEIDFALERIELTAANSALSGVGTARVTEDGSGNAITMARTFTEDGNGNTIPTASSDTSHSVALDFSTSGNQQIRQGERNTYVYYIAVPSYAGTDDITITLWGSHRGIGVAKIVEKEDVTLSRNSVATVRISVKGEWDWAEEVDPNELRGVFSIGNGRTVRFSRGNLQYRFNPTPTWRFAEHQYDFVGGYEDYYIDEGFGEGDLDGNMGEDNYNNAVGIDNYTGWLDLFAWGSWAPGGSSPRYTHGYPSPPTSWYTTIDGASDWFTMSESEWEYLLFQRDNASSKVGIASLSLVVGVSGAEGLVILPDDWVLPTGCTFTPGVVVFDESEGSYTGGNRYNLQQWMEMEAAGAVFLPAGGYRIIYSDEVVHVFCSYYIQNWYYSLQGCYWTTTTYHDTYDDGASCLSFSLSNYTIGGEEVGYVDNIGGSLSHAGTAASVRLVREYQSSKNGKFGKKRTK